MLDLGGTRWMGRISHKLRGEGGHANWRKQLDGGPKAFSGRCPVREGVAQCIPSAPTQSLAREQMEAEAWFQISLHHSWAHLPMPPGLKF